jgi:SAM-dependent methyltransferase
MHIDVSRPQAHTPGVEVFGAVAFHCAPLREARKLIVSFEDAGLRRLLAGFGPATAALRLDASDWRTSVAVPGPVLPCSAGSFDVAVMCRMARHSASIAVSRLLGELRRVIRPAGSLVLLDHRDDFGFAPLPTGGQTHLLRRWLIAAGFGELQFANAAPEWLVTAARRSPDVNGRSLDAAH